MEDSSIIDFIEHPLIEEHNSTFTSYYQHSFAQTLSNNTLLCVNCPKSINHHIEITENNITVSLYIIPCQSISGKPGIKIQFNDSINESNYGCIWYVDSEIYLSDLDRETMNQNTGLFELPNNFTELMNFSSSVIYFNKNGRMISIQLWKKMIFNQLSDSESASLDTTFISPSLQSFKSIIDPIRDKNLYLSCDTYNPSKVFLNRIASSHFHSLTLDPISSPRSLHQPSPLPKEHNSHHHHHIKKKMKKKYKKERIPSINIESKEPTILDIDVLVQIDANITTTLYQLLTYNWVSIPSKNNKNSKSLHPSLYKYQNACVGEIKRQISKSFLLANVSFNQKSFPPITFPLNSLNISNSSYPNMIRIYYSFKTGFLENNDISLLQCKGYTVISNNEFCHSACYLSDILPDTTNFTQSSKPLIKKFIYIIVSHNHTTQFMNLHSLFSSFFERMTVPSGNKTY